MTIGYHPIVRNVTEALGRLGAHAVPALPALAALLPDGAANARPGQAGGLAVSELCIVATPHDRRMAHAMCVRHLGAGLTQLTGLSD